MFAPLLVNTSGASGLLPGKACTLHWQSPGRQLTPCRCNTPALTFVPRTEDRLDWRGTFQLLATCPVDRHKKILKTPCLPLAFALLLVSWSGAGKTSTDTIYFTEEAHVAGLDFRHFNGMSGEFYLPEIMGAGAAFLDYDNDGDLDVYLVQGAMLGPGKKLTDAILPPPPGQALQDRLFRNDLQTGPDGKRRLRFTDVTATSAIRAETYGMGVATGDFDSDGFTDLYVTNFGPDQLLRNNGDGTFSDVTDKAGVGNADWSVSAAFVDYDRDGRLDLYVGNYVEVDLVNHRQCYAPSSALDYCTPRVHKAYPDRLYRNRGDGSFEDVSQRAGIAEAFGAALGVVVIDVDGDGWPDIYVANDASANQLWLNRGNGMFREDAEMAGAAVNMEGAAEGSMGVDAADFDGDGDMDLFMTHLTRETNTIYVNDGQGWFEDRTIAMGLAAPSKAYTGFGTGWRDFDNDGWLDIFSANGAVNVIRSLSDQSDPFPLHQTNQLFMNQGGKRFSERSSTAGTAFRVSEVSRGACFGDVDNDGDTDILITNNSGPVRLLVNQTGNRASWTGLRVVDATGRDALGARVEIRHAGGKLWRRVGTDGSYASASDPRLIVGLGKSSSAPDVVVHWPDGRAEVWRSVPLRAYSTLRQGEGVALPGIGDRVDD